MRYCCNVRIHSLEIRGLCLMKWPTSKMLQDLSYFLNVIKKNYNVLIWYSKNMSHFEAFQYEISWYQAKISVFSGVYCVLMYFLGMSEKAFVTFFHSWKFIKCFNFFPTKNCIQCFSIFSCLLHIPKAPSINYVDEFLDFLNPPPPM